MSKFTDEEVLAQVQEFIGDSMMASIRELLAEVWQMGYEVGTSQGVDYAQGTPMTPDNPYLED